MASWIVYWYPKIICVLFVSCKVVIFVLFLCSGQIFVPSSGGQYVLPHSTTRVSGVVDG